MYATRTRRVKTDRRDARALADACVLGAYRRAHRLSDGQRYRLPRHQRRWNPPGSLVEESLERVNGTTARTRAIRASGSGSRWTSVRWDTMPTGALPDASP